MQSQVYLQGRLAGNPEILATKKGKLMVRVLLDTHLVRETQPGEYQNESVTLPVLCFSQPAEQVKGLRKDDPLTVGVHLYGTEFTTNEGVVRRGVQLVADAVFLPPKRFAP